MLVTEVMDYFRDKFGANVEEDAEGTPEDVYFPLPQELRPAGAGQTQL